MQAYVLIVMTYLGGASWGPTVAMERFGSEALCRSAAKQIVAQLETMNQSNLAGGQARRDILSTRCVPADSKS
ncbi:MAG TPA: hypothetical protein VJ654_11290 [Noviherbaspirillum sp.]|nr:hypothetical protein [Noviherbaspirillum sp.]